jgi:hypothetical protein
MFGKRKSKEPMQQPDPNLRPTAPGAASEPPNRLSMLSTVIVPRSALAKGGEPGDYALVQAVVKFFHAMTQQGLYSRFELAPRALQAFHADFYLAQVNHGGHSQFIHNCFQNLPVVLADVHAGLMGMNAQRFPPIFEHAAAWIAANSDEVKKQTGFAGGGAPLLDELDSAFMAPTRMLR